MIYREGKRKQESGWRWGWERVGGSWQGGLNMMQTIWRGECRLPAQPALFKLERKWPYIQHASNRALFSLAHTYIHTIAEVSPWPLAAEGVCYCNIMFLYITILATVTIIIIIPIITIFETQGQTAGQEEREHEEDRKLGKKRQAEKWKTECEGG